jgi:hypothetical protein
LDTLEYVCRVANNKTDTRSSALFATFLSVNRQYYLNFIFSKILILPLIHKIQIQILFYLQSRIELPNTRIIVSPLESKRSLSSRRNYRITDDIVKYNKNHVFVKFVKAFAVLVHWSRQICGTST